MEPNTISELPFKDLYVRVDDGADRDSPSRFNPVPQQGVNPFHNLIVPEEYHEDIALLRQKLRKPDEDDFAVTHDGIRLRVARYPTVADQRWASMRRFPRDLPNLEQLNFAPEILQAFRSFGKRSGLIVIGGATGAGKTTTAVGILTDYLRTLGGLAYTIEDPVEYLMQGPFVFNPENAFVIQREVRREEDWAEGVKKALRSAPKYIFLGEVRTPAAAEQLLRAANSGHLVICTLHGGSLEQTLSAILQISQAALGELASMLLADGLCAVVHQQIVQGRAHVKLLTVDPGAGNPVRAAIRAGSLHQLGTVIDAQEVTRAKAAETAARAPAAGTPPPRPAQPSQRPATAAPPPPAASKKTGFFR